jgi:2-C-methyl-D-erythritol 4-phosphate cytidylyltransferase
VKAGAVIVAGGRGERFGESGKVLAEVAGRPMLAWSLDVFDGVPDIREIVVVAGAHTRDRIETLIEAEGWRNVSAVVDGGIERSASVANGVNALASDIEIVVIHDAARPLLRVDDVTGAIEGAARCGAAIVATPVTDTLKHCADDLAITRTIDRSRLWAAQTPQAFQMRRLQDAFTRGDMTGITDEAMLFEALGLRVDVVPGRRDNVKVTVPEDLPLVDFLMRRRLEDAR